MPEEKKLNPDMQKPRENPQPVESQVKPVSGEPAGEERVYEERASHESAGDENFFDEGEEEISGMDVDEQVESRPAVVINVQSWATPIVGLLMLVVGLLGGYFGRPLLSEPAAPAGSAALTSPAPVATAPANETGSTASAADRASLMEFLVSQTRHFRGDPEAPVTLIEFSDFQ